MGKDTSLQLAVLPKELRLILFIINRQDKDGGFQDNNELFMGVDWDLFLQLVDHHRVFPTVYLALKKMDNHWIPQYVIETLYRKYFKNTLQMLYLSRETEQISRLFLENDIRVLFLRGPVLADDLYGDISHRTSVDLDIFVSLNDLDKIDDLLLDFGYLKNEYFSTVLNEWKWRHHHLNYIHPQSGLKLEIHWRLSEGPGKEPCFGELWKRKRKSSLTSYPVYYLEKEDLFLLLVTHGARHGWSRLRWLADIDRLVKQGLDCSKLKKLMKKNHCLHVGGQALILASHLLSTPMAEELKALTLSNRPKRLAHNSLFYISKMVNLHTYPVPEDVARYHQRYLFSLMSYQKKLLFIMSFFYPYPMDAEVLPLPKYLHFLYFPLRPILWAWRKTRKPALS